MLVNQGTVRVAARSAAGLLFWHGPFGIESPVVKILPRRMRSREGLLLIGLGCEVVDERPAELFWQRDRPDEVIGIAELRAIKREMMIQGREHLRRETGLISFRTYMDTRVDMLSLDGKRILNPVGFGGHKLYVRAVHRYVDHDVAHLLKALKEAAPRLHLRPFVLDRLASALAPWTVSGVQVLVGEGGTAVRTRDGTRHVLAIGEETVFTYLRRAATDVSQGTIQQYRSRIRERNQRDRELTAHALPAMRRWARGIEARVYEAVKGEAAPEVPVIFAFTIPLPFAHIFKPQVRRHVFQRLPKAKWQSTTLIELLNRPDCRTAHDAYAALLLEAQKRDTVAMNWM